MQLRAMHMEEARKFGAVRAAAADSLVRGINDLLPHGWGVGINFQFKKASTWADWITELGLHIRGDVVEEQAKRVWDYLCALPPPTGWKPASPEDPLIREAFDRAWVDG